MRVVFVLLLLLSKMVILKGQAPIYSGTVVLNDGTTRTGTIYASTVRGYHEKISFKDSKDNKDYTYFPGDIKEYSIKGPTLIYYESLSVDSTGSHFFTGVCG